MANDFRMASEIRRNLVEQVSDSTRAAQHSVTSASRATARCRVGGQLFLRSPLLGFARELDFSGLGRGNRNESRNGLPSEGAQANCHGYEP